MNVLSDCQNSKYKFIYLYLDTVHCIQFQVRLKYLPPAAAAAAGYADVPRGAGEQRHRQAHGHGQQGHRHDV